MIKNVDINARDTIVVLDGGETEVVFGAKYSYFALANNGSGNVLMSIASGKSDADDGVRIIPPGGSATIAAPGLSDRVFVTGTGRVQISALIEPTNPFKLTAKGGDDSGDITPPLPPVMPYTDGFIGLYTAETWNDVNNVWESRIEGGPRSARGYSSGAYRATRVRNVIYLPDEYSSLSFEVDKTPRVIYFCACLNGHYENTYDRQIFTSLVETRVEALGKTDPNIFVKYAFPPQGDRPRLICSSVMEPEASTDDPLIDNELDFIVVCSVLNENGLSFYLNGELVKTVPYDRDTDHVTMIYLNLARHFPTTNWEDMSKLYTFLAFGDAAHTEEQIKANSEWLMRKYGG